MEKKEIIIKKSILLSKCIESEIDGLVRSRIEKIISGKDCRVNGIKVKEDCLLNKGDILTVYYDKYKVKKFFEIVYEDENIAIVNKAQGIEVCDGEHNIERMLIRNGEYHAVHRIDRNTEGLVLFAKSKSVEKILCEAIKEGEEIEKIYLAEVFGRPKTNNFIAHAYLLKDAAKSQVLIKPTATQGAEAIETQVELVEEYGLSSVLKVSLKSGKTHQIRAHLAYLGLPIIGDGKYGDYDVNKKFGAKMQRLTASEIKFQLTNRKLSYLNDKVFVISPTWRLK